MNSSTAVQAQLQRAFADCQQYGGSAACHGNGACVWIEQVFQAQQSGTDQTVMIGNQTLSLSFLSAECSCNAGFSGQDTWGFYPQDCHVNNAAASGLHVLGMIIGAAVGCLLVARLAYFVARRRNVRNIIPFYVASTICAWVFFSLFYLHLSAQDFRIIPAWAASDHLLQNFLWLPRSPLINVFLYFLANICFWLSMNEFFRTHAYALQKMQEIRFGRVWVGINILFSFLLIGGFVAYTCVLFALPVPATPLQSVTSRLQNLSSSSSSSTGSITFAPIGINYLGSDSLPSVIPDTLFMPDDPSLAAAMTASMSSLWADYLDGLQRTSASLTALSSADGVGRYAASNASFVSILDSVVVQMEQQRIQDAASSDSIINRVSSQPFRAILVPTEVLPSGQTYSFLISAPANVGLFIALLITGILLGASSLYFLFLLRRVLSYDRPKSLAAMSRNRSLNSSHMDMRSYNLNLADVHHDIPLPMGSKQLSKTSKPLVVVDSSSPDGGALADDVIVLGDNVSLQQKQQQHQQEHQEHQEQQQQQQQQGHGQPLPTTANVTDDADDLPLSSVHVGMIHSRSYEEGLWSSAAADAADHPSAAPGSPKTMPRNTGGKTLRHSAPNSSAALNAGTNNINFVMTSVEERPSPVASSALSSALTACSSTAESVALEMNEIAVQLSSAMDVGRSRSGSESTQRSSSGQMLSSSFYESLFVSRAADSLHAVDPSDLHADDPTTKQHSVGIAIHSEREQRAPAISSLPATVSESHDAPSPKPTVEIIPNVHSVPLENNRNVAAAAAAAAGVAISAASESSGDHNAASRHDGGGGRLSLNELVIMNDDIQLQHRQAAAHATTAAADNEVRSPRSDNVFWRFLRSLLLGSSRQQMDAARERQQGQDQEQKLQQQQQQQQQMQQKQHSDSQKKQESELELQAMSLPTTISPNSFSPPPSTVSPNSFGSPQSAMAATPVLDASLLKSKSKQLLSDDSIAMEELDTKKKFWMSGKTNSKLDPSQPFLSAADPLLLAGNDSSSGVSSLTAFSHFVKLLMVVESITILVCFVLYVCLSVSLETRRYMFAVEFSTSLFMLALTTCACLSMRTSQGT